MLKNIKKFTSLKKYNTGFVLLEIILAVALISIVFTTLLGVGAQVLNVSNSIQKETQADLLVKEEFEAVRNFRDGTEWVENGLGLVGTGIDNPYHLVNNSGKWELVSGSGNIGIFTRKVIFDNVSRDAVTKNIEDNYNQLNYDSDTKKVTIVVAWDNRMLQVVSYFTNWKNN